MSHNSKPKREGKTMKTQTDTTTYYLSPPPWDPYFQDPLEMGFIGEPEAFAVSGKTHTTIRRFVDDPDNHPEVSAYQDEETGDRYYDPAELQTWARKKYLSFLPLWTILQDPDNRVPTATAAGIAGVSYDKMRDAMADNLVPFVKKEETKNKRLCRVADAEAFGRSVYGPSFIPIQERLGWPVVAPIQEPPAVDVVANGTETGRVTSPPAVEEVAPKTNGGPPAKDGFQFPTPEAFAAMPAALQEVEVKLYEESRRRDLNLEATP